MDVNRIYCEPCDVTLSRMVHGDFTNCITSPPYYGLRDYGTAKWEGGDVNCDHSYFKGGRNPDKSGKQMTNTGTQLSQYEKICGKCGAIRIDEQIGLEETPEMYVKKLVAVFHEVKRAMADDGTLWLNLGDTYYNYRGANDYSTKQTIANHEGHAMHSACGKRNSILPNLKGKDLIGIPWMVAFALRADGWHLRQDIIWHKPNPMPESVTDRCTKAHEYIFLLSKSARYYYDAEAIWEKANYDGRNDTVMKASGKYADGNFLPDKNANGVHSRGHERWVNSIDGVRARNKRSVWEVTTKPFKEAHFAVYPEELIEPCVLTTKKDAVIYDPFGGSGTTGVVALRAGRKFIMSELNPEYVKIAERRLQPHLHNLFT